MSKVIRWGIMGAGGIVDSWICGAKQLDDMEVVAIASRNVANAEKAAKKHGIPEFMSYEELVNRDDIDIVYVPTINTVHKEMSIMAMEHGKAVLVEKPAAVNEKQVQEMVDCARANKVFFMEAVWTRFFPLVQKVKEFIGPNGIGNVRAMNLGFSFRVPDAYCPGRWLNINQAGGGLLDVGVYDIHFVNEILGKDPVAMTGFASMDMDEYHAQVDEQASFIFQYDRGELVMMHCAVRTDMSNVGMIYGDKGHIEIPRFWRPVEMKVVIGDKEQVFTSPIPNHVDGYVDKGYQYEIAHINDCLRQGLIESPVMTHEKSLTAMRQCDALRRQWGLKYPME